MVRQTNKFNVVTVVPYVCWKDSIRMRITVLGIENIADVYARYACVAQNWFPLIDRTCTRECSVPINVGIMSVLVKYDRLKFEIICGKNKHIMTVFKFFLITVLKVWMPPKKYCNILDFFLFRFENRNHFEKKFFFSQKTDHTVRLQTLIVHLQRFITLFV